MTYLSKSLFAFILLLAGFALSHNSCRLCAGDQRIIFDKFTFENEAVAFLKASLGNCATGADFEITRVRRQNCVDPCTTGVVKTWTNCAAFGNFACKYYIFDVKIWRYCGNGGFVRLTKGGHCIGPRCATLDTLAISCTKSVECRGDCDCVACGC